MKNRIAAKLGILVACSIMAASCTTKTTVITGSPPRTAESQMTREERVVNYERYLVSIGVDPDNFYTYIIHRVGKEHEREYDYFIEQDFNSYKVNNVLVGTTKSELRDYLLSQPKGDVVFCSHYKLVIESENITKDFFTELDFPLIQFWVPVSSSRTGWVNVVKPIN